VLGGSRGAMADLTITTTVESWARRRRRQRFLDEGMRALAAGLVVGGGTLALVVWVPSLSFLLIPASMAVVGLGAFVGWRMRHAIKPDDVAAVVDAQADTDGLIRTALAVEGGRATASREIAGVIRSQAVERLTELDEIGAPPLSPPTGPTLVSAVAAVALSIVFAITLVAATLPGGALAPVASVPAFDQERAAELGAALKELEDLAQEPGLEPLSKRDLELARDHMRSALSARDDPQQAARELDEARRALQNLEGKTLTSSAALQSAPPEDLAKGLDRALTRGDPGAARRLGEEVLRRVDGGASDGELRRLGKALAEGVKSKTQAGGAAREAGRALQAGEKGTALSALADLMAELGEPVRLEPRREALAQASDAVEEARQDAVNAMDPESGQERGQGERQEPSEGSETADGQQPPDDGATTPSPVEGRQGGEGDGGGGMAKGGTEDLRKGGTPGAGGDPEVRVDGERPAGGREEGPDAEGGRLVAGEGEARDGSAPQDAAAGAGEGDVMAEGGLPSDDAAGEGGALVAGGGPASETFGMGEGSGATLDVPLLELEPGTVAEEWVDLQWDGAGEAMGQVLDHADAGGRTGMAWQEVHKRYSGLAESATRRSQLPLTRRTYVRRYFEAIRPTSGGTSAQDANPTESP